MSQIQVRRFEPGDLPACEAILRALPDWFGIEEANLQYIRDFGDHETYVAVRDGSVSGVLTLKTHSPFAAEVWFMAVSSALQRHGIGRALLLSVEDVLRARGIEYLQVKTLSASHPDAGYTRTRAFYEAVGFRPLEEMLTLWDERNPAQVYVKAL